MPAKLKSKPFRIATAGATTDGRVIEADWLEQMAANYNPEKYTARLNCEHWRGMVPDGDFKAFGNVLELSTETVSIDGEDKLALMATIEPTADLVALNRKGQKLFTSMEVDTSFADSDEAYLVGLAVTDSPASLGTEMLSFAAGQKDNNPLNTRKQKPENLFSAATPAAFEFDDETTITDRLKEIFTRSNKQQSEQNNKNADFSAAVLVIGEEVAGLQEKITSLQEEFSKAKGDDPSQVSELTNELEDLKGKFNTLITQLKKETDPNFSQRPPATGGDGVAEVDFC